MTSLFSDNKFPTSAGIYKITTLHNSKFYIGSSIFLKKRMKEHKTDLRKGNHFVKYLQKVYNKYGENNFKVEFLYIAENSFELNSKNHKELLKLEEKHIALSMPEYNTILTPTTQINNPSTSKKVYQYTIEGEFVKEWVSSSEVKRKLNIQPQNSLKGLNRSAGGFRWTYKKQNWLPKYKANQGSSGAVKISCYNIWGKKLITFNSIKECCITVFPEKETGKIRQTIEKFSKKTKVYEGYRFCLGEKENIDNSINLTHKHNFIILQYDLKMNFIKIWSNITEAQKLLNITSIYDNLSGKTKQAGGFIWQKLK